MTAEIPQPRHAPLYREVAASIAPTDCPPWLPTMLGDWAPTIAISRGVYEKQPTKVEMREELNALRDAATALQLAIQNTAIKEFLEIEGRIQIENIGGLDHALSTIAERASLAATSGQITIKGAGKALPTGAITPKTFCAVMISEIWKYIHGEYPAPRNEKATAAAEAYWRASGGEIKGWSDNPATSWRYHFEKAQSTDAEKDRKEIQRHCVEYSRQFQELSEAGK